LHSRNVLIGFVLFFVVSLFAASFNYKLQNLILFTDDIVL